MIVTLYSCQYTTKMRMLCSKLPYSHKHALYSCVKQAKPVLEATVGRRIGHVGRLRCQRPSSQLSSEKTKTATSPPRLLASCSCLTGLACLHPAAAQAATLPTNDATNHMYLISAGVGTACALLTLLATSRFLMSYFPILERKAKLRRMPWAFFTMVDPILHPLQRGLFRMEPGDLNLGAVAMLACVSSLLETLVGEGGLWLESIPDLDLLHHMRYLVLFQHGLLLPSWTMVVLRFFALI